MKKNLNSKLLPWMLLVSTISASTQIHIIHAASENSFSEPPASYLEEENQENTSTLSPDAVSEMDNGLFWIDEGTTYRSGAVLQFYATGAGYGPEEPQELNPIDQSVRYIPMDWCVASTSSSGSETSITGVWTEYSEVTSGQTYEDKDTHEEYYKPGEYRFKDSFCLNTTSTSSVPFTLTVNYQKQVYDGQTDEWQNSTTAVSKSVNFYIRNVDTPVSPVPPAAPDIASEADNGLFWIDAGVTYRSGATLHFYATGAGYGPEEPQELNPIDQSVRYVPVNWNVASTSASVSGSQNTKGAWADYTEANHTSGEYRFKGSFSCKTTGSSSVPFILTVNYQKQVYDGANGIWRNSSSTVSRKVYFYIKNTESVPLKPAPYKFRLYIDNNKANNSKIEAASKHQLRLDGALLPSKVSFTSSNKKIAKVNKKTGKITALKAGTATITVKSPATKKYQAFSKKIKIKVIPKPVRLKPIRYTQIGHPIIKSTKATRGNTGYIIQYTQFGTTRSIKVKQKGALNYTLKKVTPGSFFSYSVCAYRKVGNTTYKGKMSVPTWVVTPRPATPTPYIRSLI